MVAGFSSRPQIVGCRGSRDCPLGVPTLSLLDQPRISEATNLHIHIYIYIYLHHSVYVCLCLCAATGLYGDPPLHLASRELSSLAKRSEGGRLCRPPPPLILLESIPSRKGNNLRVVSFHQFPTFLTFLLLLFFMNGTQIGFHLPITYRYVLWKRIDMLLIAPFPILFSTR